MSRLGLVPLIAGASTAAAQLVVGNAQANPSLWLVDVSGGLPPRELLAGSAARCTALAADDARQNLYWTDGFTLFRANYTWSGEISPQVIGTLNAQGTITALAFDTSANMLLGRSSTGIWWIRTDDATCYLTLSTGAQDFGGLEYESATDSFLAVNDSSLTTLVPGRGLYRIRKPMESPTFERITAYPVGENDLDGLAMGNGRAYLVRDSAGETAEVFDLALQAYVGTVPLPFTGIDGISAGAAWAPGLMEPPAPPCDPDINCDGSADQGDVACLVLLVAGDSACSCGSDGDFNADGSADQGDVAALILVVAGFPCGA